MNNLKVSTDTADIVGMSTLTVETDDIRSDSSSPESEFIVFHQDPLIPKPNIRGASACRTPPRSKMPDQQASCVELVPVRISNDRGLFFDTVIGRSEPLETLQLAIETALNVPRHMQCLFSNHRAVEWNKSIVENKCTIYRGQQRGVRLTVRARQGGLRVPLACVLPNRRTVSLWCGEKDTIHDIKEQLTNALQQDNSTLSNSSAFLDPHRFTLTYRNVSLYDAETLRYYRVPPRAELHVRVRRSFSPLAVDDDDADHKRRMLSSNGMQRPSQTRAMPQRALDGAKQLKQPCEERARLHLKDDSSTASPWKHSKSSDGQFSDVCGEVVARNGAAPMQEEGEGVVKPAHINDLCQRGGVDPVATEVATAVKLEAGKGTAPSRTSVSPPAKKREGTRSASASSSPRKLSPHLAHSRSLSKPPAQRVSSPVDHDAQAKEVLLGLALDRIDQLEATVRRYQEILAHVVTDDGRPES